MDLSNRKGKYMEKWIEVCKGRIPNDIYVVRLENGEENGLLIKLEGNKYEVLLSFGIIPAMRMIEEGTLLMEGVSGEEMDKYSVDHFPNVIYQIEDGEFGGQVEKMYGQLYKILKLNHYIIITLNYVIEIISDEVPTIEVKECFQK